MNDDTISRQAAIKMAKDPCEICREQVILELFARIGGRTLGQKDCENCNVRRERKDG